MLKRWFDSLPANAAVVSTVVCGLACGAGGGPSAHTVEATSTGVVSLVEATGPEAAAHMDWQAEPWVSALAALDSLYVIGSEEALGMSPDEAAASMVETLNALPELSVHTPEQRASFEAGWTALSNCTATASADGPFVRIPAQLLSQLPDDAQQVQRRLESAAHFDVACTNGGPMVISVADGRVVAWVDRTPVEPADLPENLFGDP